MAQPGAGRAIEGAPARTRGLVEVAVVAAGATLLLAIVRSAWMCDDAFITLRTVDNLVHGFGPRWNVAERVQTFTHPLWMLLLALVYFFTREPYYSVLGVSIVVSGVVAWWLVTRVAASPSGALLALVVLILSKAYVDYSTSGLENPLSFLLLVLFVSALLRVAEGKGGALAAVLAAGLSVLNRMDLLLLVLPGVLFALRGLPRHERVRTLLIGFSPFLAWELFALVYYGFPFPNSAYAKLVTGLPRSALVQQGYHYFVNSLRLDPVTLVAIGASALFVGRRRIGAELALMAGVALYLAYVLWIGGDFMSGRFLAAPLVVSAALLAQWKPVRPGLVVLPCCAVAVLGLVNPRSPVYSGADYADKRRIDVADAARITDERAFFYNETGLLRAGRGAPMPDHPSAHDGRKARQGGPAVAVRGGVGFFGYYAGPAVHVVEPWAVTDPLLARIPVAAGTSWRIGHFQREIPPGYVKTLLTGENHIADPQVARLYAALDVVTRGPLFSGRRLLEIWKLNAGRYRIPRGPRRGGSLGSIEPGTLR